MSSRTQTEVLQSLRTLQREFSWLNDEIVDLAMKDFSRIENYLESCLDMITEDFSLDEVLTSTRYEWNSYKIAKAILGLMFDASPKGDDFFS